MKLLLHFVIAVFTFCFLYGCLDYQSPRYVKIAHKITDETAATLLKEKKLYLVGTGGGMMHDIQMMAMSFDYYQEIDLKTARGLLLYAVNEYLSNINNNEEVRSYLHEYPFTPKNVEIEIFIYNPDGTNISSDKINTISASDGNLTYCTIIAEKFYSKTILKETYEEGMKKLHEK